MKRVNSIEDRSGNGLPVVALDFAAGRHVVSSEVAQSMGPLDAGGFQITATAHIYLSAGVNPVASAGPGSLFVAAGTPFHIALPALPLGDEWSISVISATAVAAHVFIVPLA